MMLFIAGMIGMFLGATLVWFIMAAVALGANDDRAIGVRE